MSDCRLYTHVSSPTLSTGFVAKYSFDGDGATSRRRQLPIITGYLELASTWAPCAGGQTSGDTDGDTHVLTDASASSTTHVSGYSCFSVVLKSHTVAGGSEDDDVTASPYYDDTGPRSNKSMGFEGIISSYNTQQRLHNIIPSLPAAGVDETSQFQIFPSSRNTPRLHLPNCNKEADVGCSAYDVEWAKVGCGDQSIAQLSGVVWRKWTRTSTSLDTLAGSQEGGRATKGRHESERPRPSLPSQGQQLVRRVGGCGRTHWLCKPLGYASVKFPFKTC